MKILVNTLGNVLLTILVMLLIGYSWAFFEIKIMLKPYPELFGYIFYQETDDEMAADFNEDDIIIIKKNAEYNVGDRVLYLEGNNKYDVETVVNKDDLSTTTTCNTCIENSEPVDNSAVLGRAVGKIIYFGKFINFFKQKAVLITLAVFGFICVVASQYIGSAPVKKVATKM